jgi:L-glutamine-phosphate cytidylyltransferase
MRAIILAAGMGTRLGDLTQDTPKALMTLRGRTLLERQIAGYRDAGVTDIAVVRGYLADHITYEGVTYYENADYATTGLLPSLFAALPAMDGGFVFSYADTTWRTEHVSRLVAALDGTQDMAVVVDTAWKDVYVGRDQHPLDEAECVAVGDGRVERIGKCVTPDQAYGEVAGMGGFSPAAAAKAVDAWTRLSSGGLDVPFGQKKVLRHAYVADLMQHLADTQGVAFRTVDVQGGWREIDTPQDLACAERDVDW